mmetsp:Transcript_22230/g.61908  ORF Transcript_22230/g.61908 Transcript_22230/m.61908 type:complete len:238 (-) Transcript_22230:960-1673(-)
MIASMITSVIASVIAGAFLARLVVRFAGRPQGNRPVDNHAVDGVAGTSARTAEPAAHGADNVTAESLRGPQDVGGRLLFLVVVLVALIAVVAVVVRRLIEESLNVDNAIFVVFVQLVPVGFLERPRLGGFLLALLEGQAHRHPGVLVKVLVAVVIIIVIISVDLDLVTFVIAGTGLQDIIVVVRGFVVVDAENEPLGLRGLLCSDRWFGRVFQDAARRLAPAVRVEFVFLFVFGSSG